MVSVLRKLGFVAEGVESSYIGSRLCALCAYDPYIYAHMACFSLILSSQKLFRLPRCYWILGGGTADEAQDTYLHGSAYREHV